MTTPSDSEVELSKTMEEVTIVTPSPSTEDLLLAPTDNQDPPREQRKERKRRRVGSDNKDDEPQPSTSSSNSTAMETERPIRRPAESRLLRMALTKMDEMDSFVPSNKHGKND